MLQLSEKGDLALLENLVRKSPDILNEKDECGAGPLHHAAAGGHVSLLQFITTVTSQGKRTSVIHHSRKGEICARKQQRSVWCCMIQYDWFFCAVCGSNERGLFLLGTAGALLDLNSCDEQGNVPLHWAVERNEAESCRALLDLGANPNILNNALLSPLHLAISCGHNGLVKVGLTLMRTHKVCRCVTLYNISMLTWISRVQSLCDTIVSQVLILDHFSKHNIIDFFIRSCHIVAYFMLFVLFALLSTY